MTKININNVCIETQVRRNGNVYETAEDLRDALISSEADLCLDIGGWARVNLRELLDAGNITEDCYLDAINEYMACVTDRCAYVFLPRDYDYRAENDPSFDERMRSRLAIKHKIYINNVCIETQVRRNGNVYETAEDLRDALLSGQADLCLDIGGCVLVNLRDLYDAGNITDDCYMDAITEYMAYVTKIE